MVPKFRGKRKDNGEWVVGVPIPNSFCNVVHMIPILLTDKIAYPPERLHEYLIEILPETLGQSTGLKDKNGVEIFEGDVLTSNVQPCKMVNPIKDGYGVVRFENGMFKLGAISLVTFISKMEVISNIYENPELLEQAHEN